MGSFHGLPLAVPAVTLRAGEFMVLIMLEVPMTGLTSLEREGRGSMFFGNDRFSFFFLVKCLAGLRAPKISYLS